MQSVCDRVALFSKGRIGLAGRVEDLMRDVLGGSYVIDLEATGDDLQRRLSSIPGVRHITPLAGHRLRIDADADVRSPIAAAVIENRGDLRELSMGTASLEDVYTRYFEGVRHAA